MRLIITTPARIVVDDSNVTALRAADETGSFGILQGHADFLTALTVSVAEWRQQDGTMRYCAVRQGVLTVSGGKQIAIATREAIVGDDLGTLEQTVINRFNDEIEADRAGRQRDVQFQMKAIRQIVRYLRPGKQGLVGGGR